MDGPGFDLGDLRLAHARAATQLLTGETGALPEPFERNVHRNVQLALRWTRLTARHGRPPPWLGARPPLGSRVQIVAEQLAGHLDQLLTGGQRQPRSGRLDHVALHHHRAAIRLVHRRTVAAPTPDHKATQRYLASDCSVDRRAMVIMHRRRIFYVRLGHQTRYGVSNGRILALDMREAAYLLTHVIQARST